MVCLVRFCKHGYNMMEFIFICPQNNKVFECSNFTICDNKGVISDEAGNRSLDARVVLDDPCPFCGQKHEFHASELLCPFNG